MKLFNLLVYALQKHAPKIGIFDLTSVPLDVRRASEVNRTSAYVRFACPDEVARNISGDKDKRDIFLVIRIPREVAGRAESRIVLPGE